MYEMESINEFLVDHGYDNISIIRCACKHGRLDVVKHYTTSSGGADLFEYACILGQLDIAKHFYDIRGNAILDLDVTLALTCSVRLDSVDVVEYLVELGADVQYNDSSSLRSASEQGNVKIVKYLITKGANIHANDNYAIKYAALYGHLEVVEVLLYSGAKLDKVMDYASDGCSSHVMKFLSSKRVENHTVVDRSDAIKDIYNNYL